ncbi:MAG: hypothetical protein LCH95_22070 [Proteobacteria bacterium]|nr:hypothetical protein [Pseudomonadota bacterium]
MWRWAMVLAAVAVSAAARAETWQAQTTLVPNATVKCVDISLAFQFTNDNGTLTMRTPGNATYSAPINPDGTVSLQYTGRGGLGTIVLSGNARTRDLQLTAPRSLPGCRYALREAAPAAAPEVRTQWKTTIQQVAGNVQSCGSGNRGHVIEAGPNIYLFDAGYRTTEPYMAARLKPDGSFDGDVRTAFGTYSVARLKVPAGTGPRVLEYVFLTTVCRYRVLPD